jgi:hypothetical protein
MSENISVLIMQDNFKLHDDLEAYLVHHDFEFSMYDDLEDYLEDFLETHEIDWTRSVFHKKPGRHVYYSFDITEFNCALDSKYDTDDFDT